MTRYETDIQNGQARVRVIIDGVAGTWHIVARQTESCRVFRQSANGIEINVVKTDGSVAAVRAIVAGSVVSVLDDSPEHDEIWSREFR